MPERFFRWYSVVSYRIRFLSFTYQLAGGARMRGFAVGIGTGIGVGSSYSTCQYKVYGNYGGGNNITDKADLEK